jgi:alpha-ketoglutarate-dependent 2,4-dichlorophenoxyacetate dioxygenase
MAKGDVYETKHLKATQVGDTFVGVVEGVDFSTPLQTPEISAEIEELIGKYGVLIFKATPLDDQAHIEFSKSFGELDSREKYSEPGKKFRMSDYRLYDAGNLDMEGNILPRETREFQFKMGNALWHTDGSFNQHRQSYSLLRAVIVPPSGTGGNTQFADARSAYAGFSPELKQQLQGLVAFHYREHSRKQGCADYAATEFEKTVRPGSRHKIIQTHPCGTTNLYIGAHAYYVEGMERERGIQFIKDLIKMASPPELVFDFEWQQVGDIVMWDNRTVMHRSAGVPSLDYKRDLRRTSVLDNSAFAHGAAEQSVEEIAA